MDKCESMSVLLTLKDILLFEIAVFQHVQHLCCLFYTYWLDVLYLSFIFSVVVVLYTFTYKYSVSLVSIQVGSYQYPLQAKFHVAGVAHIVADIFSMCVYTKKQTVKHLTFCMLSHKECIWQKMQQFLYRCIKLKNCCCCRPHMISIPYPFNSQQFLLLLLVTVDIMPLR